MPVPLRGAFHKAEAKYNVTTEFPNLGLHAAAATGNVGLVEYALNNGQPINSVLDGVLPLHAACAGGNVQVVKVLIDHGADVNAPRLPRKYSIDKGRDTSAPIVGTSGSTPLHFASANGNTDVVLLLLQHGAHPNRPDKHGVTPETLAKENGWVECAKLLSDWALNKDRDLRERKPGPMPDYDAHSMSSPSPRRRLHVKQSIDTALNMLKTPDHHSKTARASTPPASPQKPFGEYTFYPDQSNPVDHGSRRPSLPHISHPHSSDAERPRKNSTATIGDRPPRQRRPRSAGNGSDQSPDPAPEPQAPESETPYPVYSRGGSGRKLSSKYSLLNLFKKGQIGEAAEGAHTPENSTAFQGSTVTLPLSMAPSQSTQASNSDFHESAGTPSSLPTRAMFQHRGSDASTKGRFTPQSQAHTPNNIPPLPRKPSGNLQTPPRTNVPLAVELHLALAQQQHQRSRSNAAYTDSPGEDSEKHKPSSPMAKLNAMLLPGQNRYRSGSASSMPPPESRPIQDEDAQSVNVGTPESEHSKASPSTRPGILRAHNRTNSSGQGSSPLNSRTLRFDSASSTPGGERKGKDSSRSVPPLRSYSSAGSFTKMNIQANADSLRSQSQSSSTTENVTETSKMDKDEGHVDADDDPEYYGKPIEGLESSLGGGSDIPSVLLQRQRGNSFASSSDSSLSPILTNENANDPTMAVLNADFPFSIKRPPSSLADEQQDNQPLSTAHLSVPLASSDTRGRGDSLSSQSTTDSGNILMSSGTTSGSGGSMTISTPNMANVLTMSPRSIKSFDVQMQESPAIDFDGESMSAPATSHMAHLKHRRAPTPNIDITSISSHAQAEELVQRTRQEVLDVANANGQELVANSAGSGRTPLSASLAAYGEMLALERKLREQKEGESTGNDKDYLRESPPPMPYSRFSPSEKFLSPAPPPRQKSGEGVERQRSLEAKANVTRPKGRGSKGPRRPSTADGVLNKDESFFPPRTPTHQSSRSASSTHQPNSIGNDDEESVSDLQDNYVSTSYDATGELDLSNNDLYDMPSARARTPLHLNDPLSRVNSSDMDTETDSGTFIQRGVTHPLPTSRTQRTNEHLRSAKKLTKMGIPLANQAAATASRTVPSISPGASSSKRFQGIKSIMQTFKGKA